MTRERHDHPLQRDRRAGHGPRRRRRAGHPAARRATSVVSCDVAADDTDILLVTDAGYGKRTKLERFNRQARGGQGVRGIRLTGTRGSVVAAFMVGLDEEILLVSSGGVVIRTAAREIASQGRDATGVRVMNLDDGQTVAAVARVTAEDDDEAPGRPARARGPGRPDSAHRGLSRCVDGQGEGRLGGHVVVGQRREPSRIEEVGRRGSPSRRWPTAPPGRCAYCLGEHDLGEDRGLAARFGHLHPGRRGLGHHVDRERGGGHGRWWPPARRGRWPR